MLEHLFFALGLANNVLLIVLFWVRKNHDIVANALSHRPGRTEGTP